MDNRDVIRAYFSAINEERWEDLGNLLDEDAQYLPVGGRLRVGRETVVEGFQGLFRAWSEHLDDAQQIIVEGEAGAALVRFRGVTTAGLPIEFDAVDYFQLREGRLWKWSTWYDLPAVRAAIGGER